MEITSSWSMLVGARLEHSEHGERPSLVLRHRSGPRRSRERQASIDKIRRMAEHLAGSCRQLQRHGSCGGSRAVAAAFGPYRTKEPLVAARTSAPQHRYRGTARPGRRGRASCGLGTALMAASVQHPRHRLAWRDEFFIGQLTDHRSGAATSHPLYLLPGAAMARALTPFQRRAGAARAPDLLRGESQFEPRRAESSRAGQRLRHRVGRRTRARDRGRRRSAQRGVLRSRQDARGDAAALGAGVLCFNVENRRGELLTEMRVAANGRAGQPARQSGCRPEDPSLYRHRTRDEQFGIAVTRRAPQSRAPAAWPGSRSSASIATSGRRLTGEPRSSTHSKVCWAWSRQCSRRHHDRAHRPRRRPWHHLRRRDAAARRRARRRLARAHRRARPRRQEDRARAGLLAGRQRRHPGGRGTLLEARQQKELLHRRRRDERPDAAGAVRRLDGDRRVRSTRSGSPTPTTSSGRSANRATRSAATARSPPSPATSSPCSRPVPTP